MALQSINPTTEDVLDSFEEFSDAQVDAALQEAHDAQQQWRETSFGERASRLQAAARILRGQKGRWATLATSEMGKPLVEAEAEIDKCAWNCDYYAQHAATFLADEHIETEASESFVAFEPLGVVLAIMPWNFPFWQVFRFAAPALMAGNGAVLKHASNVPGCALAIEEIFSSAGVPRGLFRTVLIPGSRVDNLIADRRIQAVTLTGSSDVGERVASAAGRQIKKQVLELGGSDPFIVLADADLERAVATAVRARNQNNGQSCIAAKRFIVEEPVADRFTQKFAEAVKALRVGDPMQRETNIGPLARQDLREALVDQVERSVSSGAHTVVGGTPLNGKGYFYAPTVLDGVNADMPAFREETFGPVAAVIRARDPQDAVRLANDTEYGLGAALWTQDIERGKVLARRIQAGNVFINGMVASDPRLPFGGVKRSGYGRELGVFGIREFVNVQTIVVGQPSAPKPNPSE
jgi:succinate-semialdehyde dehydrogenase/glutarate-semialdehyde dehydrogenase